MTVRVLWSDGTTLLRRILSCCECEPWIHQKRCSPALLGAASRAELEEQLGRRVHLFLHVKVKSDWAEDRAVYRDMGLGWVE